jgi:iron complex transport system substrate-binding protein
MTCRYPFRIKTWLRHLHRVHRLSPLTMSGLGWLQMIALTLLLVSCAGKAHQPVDAPDEPVSSMSLSYATGFSVDYYDGYKRLTVHSPWTPGAVLARYYLTTNPKQVLPSDGLHIITPIKRLVTASCTHYAFLEMLGELDKVVGLCEPKRIYNPTLRQAYQEGRIEDLGDPFRLNVERCFMLKPDLVMVSGFNQYDERINRLLDAGTSVAYNNEWMEPGLLARAEWLKYIACFFNKEALADSLFNEVSNRYLALIKLGEQAVGTKPLILSGDNFRGTWYQPGGQSFTAKLFKDAGGRYLYEADTTRGSLPLSFEQVYKDLGEADVWVGATSGNSLTELKAQDQRYTLFKPFREGRVYAYTNRITEAGGNDFWEGAVAKPDELLADFIHLLHPACLHDHTFTYLKQLPR